MLEHIRQGKIVVSVGDEQYYKSWGMNLLVPTAENIYNRDWEILVNLSDAKFITSDAPVTIIAPSGNVPLDYIAPMYLPLTPEYALLIHSNFGLKTRYSQVTSNEATEYNREVVQWAEDMIISSTMDLSLSKLVNEYRNYCAQVELHKSQIGSRDLIFYRHKSSLKESND